MRRTPFVAALLSTALVLPVSLLSGASGAGAKPAAPDDPESSALRSPELSTSTRLAERRSLVVGDRFFEMGAENGSYPATGFHTRGEMGGFWTPPVKLLDGLWFKLGDTWLTASRYTSGWGYQRMSLGTHDGVRVTRTDFAPDGVRAGLVGLRLSAASARTVTLGVDAHSELMKVYPWGETTPNQTTYNLADTAAVDGRSLLFREQGTPPVANAEPHDYAALVGSKLTPSATDLNGAHRGPQGAIICPASDDKTTPQPARCDDTVYGKGAGGGLTYQVTVPKGGRTIWFAVAGSDRGVAEARAAQAAALSNPAALLRTKLAQRRAVRRTPACPCRGTGCSSAASPGASRTSPTRCRSPATSRSGSPTPARSTRPRRAPWPRHAGSARAGRTIPGCSRRTASTPRSRRWPVASSGRSRTICARSAT